MVYFGFVGFYVGWAGEGEFRDFELFSTLLIRTLQYLIPLRPPPGLNVFISISRREFRSKIMLSTEMFLFRLQSYLRREFRDKPNKVSAS